jgi:uncharacterized protein (DUF1697 family)
MPRYIALLRAINVGGHNVKMDTLRTLFQSLNLKNVETFIASGNVIFESDRDDTKILEQEIEKTLESALGYEVATFLRTDTEVAQIAAAPPFTPDEIAAAHTLNIGLVRDDLAQTSIETILTFNSDIDEFRVEGREVYWLCRTKQSDSTFSNAVLERKLKQKSTWRGANTLQRLAKKYPPLKS